MAALVSDAHANCYFAFERLIDALERPANDFRHQLPLPDVQEEFDKYKIWAGNVGAAHSGIRYEISLDYRLREASFFKQQVLGLLSTLDKTLTNASSLVRNQRKPFEELDEEPESGTSDPSTSDTSEVEDEASDDSPWEISSNSTRGKGSVSQRTSMVNDSAVSSAKSAPKTNSDAQVNHIMGLGRIPKAEMPRLLESIKFTIFCLYRMPIRKPAPLDRLKHKTLLNSSNYQHFDVLYVRDKFPTLDADSATRLGKMITRRRQILYYRQAHRQSLQTTRVEAKIAFAPVDGPKSAAIQVGSDGSHGGAENETTPSRLAMSQAASSHFTLRSKATTVRPGEAHLGFIQEDIDPAALYAPSVAESKSSIASSFAGRHLKIRVPSRPKDDQGNEKEWFECPYCLITKNITSKYKWKKHIMEDLQPYVCTYGHCDLYDHLFESKDAWFKHEAQHHRAKWFCNTDYHPEFDAQSDFLTHMKTDHDQKLDDAQFTLLKEMFQRPSRNINGTCNLCAQYSKKLKSHVSRHLQQMALFALPRVNETAGSGQAEHDSGSSKSAKKNDQKGEDKDDGSECSKSSSESIMTDPRSELEPDEDHISDEPHLIDEVEVSSLVPDVSNVKWDDVTDKFARARKRSFRPLTILAYGGGSEVVAVHDLIKMLHCELAGPCDDENEATRRVEGEVKFDAILVVPGRFKLDYEWEVDIVRTMRTSKVINSNTPVIYVMSSNDSRKLDPVFDASIRRLHTRSGQELFQYDELEEVLGKLCHWEPAPENSMPEPDYETSRSKTEVVEKQEPNEDKSQTSKEDRTSDAQRPEVTTSDGFEVFRTRLTVDVINRKHPANVQKDLKKYSLPLLKEQVRILKELMRVDPDTIQPRFGELAPKVFKLLEHLESSMFPYLKWETFVRVVRFQLCNQNWEQLAIGHNTPKPSYFDFSRELDKSVRFARERCPDMPMFSIGDDCTNSSLLPYKKGAVVTRRYNDCSNSIIYDPEWEYKVGNDFWEGEQALIQASANPEIKIYQRQGFRPYPCRKQDWCVLDFETFAQRRDHEEQETACKGSDEIEKFDPTNIRRRGNPSLPPQGLQAEVQDELGSQGL